jgi:hypothetical protein
MASTYNSTLDPELFFQTVMARDYLGAALGRGLWSEPGFLARLRRAHALGGAARAAAFHRLENELLRAAPLAVYGHWNGTVGYFSPRTGCRVIASGLGVLDLGVLCKK